MASCKHCGAPLAPNNNQCKYCGTRNDVDLHAKFPYQEEKTNADRNCPNCEIALRTIRLVKDEKVFIERCDNCFGLFFDRGEIEYVLQHSVSHVYDINLELIDNINKDRYRKPDHFNYRKCPQCSVLMNRVSFGHRSGVVVDRCMMHGIWLDNGELTHLLEWKKAGGQLLHTKNEFSKQETSRPKSTAPNAFEPDDNVFRGGFKGEIGWETAAALIWLIWKLFVRH